uniref:NADH-ubiquinone oxidoreductase chain 4 n=1 Tax=Paracanthobdella livanowi TaxID=2905687 RepID=A0A9E8G7M8_9ANNE|nr:NADH dehydrogenase subunit 4 [Paracanthobdella livanowi]UZT67755.1 NADH dehydrogenase subunit 4 [Paracanthobdella livanowi]
MLSISMYLMSLPFLLNQAYSWPVIISHLLMSSLLISSNMNSSPSILTNWIYMDNMSCTLMTLSTWVSGMMILASLKLIQNKPKLLIFLIITLNNIILLYFSSSKLLMFYIWFEASLIPTMLLIMFWGYQPERNQASIYLIMYTVLASLPMIASIMGLIKYNYSMMIPMLLHFSWPFSYSLMWLIMIMGFLVKLPMYSTHLWLPKAHVEAPLAGSMILAAILLKLGGYGLIRFSQLLPYMNSYIKNPIIALSLMGSVITSMICLRQTDMKALIAYSSVSHMGLLISGVMTSSKWGLSGSLAMMIAHGISSSALFILAALNYTLINTRSMFLCKGMLTFMPLLSMAWFIFNIINMAAPPSINLLSEIMLITAISTISMLNMLMLGIISFITACYSLYLYTSINHGNHSPILNYVPPLTMSNSTLLFYHLTPMLFLILKPELITNM